MIFTKFGLDTRDAEADDDEDDDDDDADNELSWSRSTARPLICGASAVSASAR